VKLRHLIISLLIVGAFILLGELVFGAVERWELTAGGDGLDEVSAVGVKPDGAFVIAGSFSAELDLGDQLLRTSSGPTAFAAEIMPDGDVTWATAIAGRVPSVATSLAVDPSGRAYVALSRQDGSAAVLALSQDGSVSWTAVVGQRADVGGIAVAPDGTLWIAGSETLDDHVAGFVARLDPGGDRIAHHRFARAQYFDVAAIDASGDGDLYVTGSFVGTLRGDAGARRSSGVTDVFVARLSPEGDVTWLETFGGPGVDGARALLRRGENLWLAGSFSDAVDFGPVSALAVGRTDGFLARITTRGGVIDLLAIGDAGTDGIRALAASRRDDVVALVDLGGRSEVVGYRNGAAAWTHTLETARDRLAVRGLATTRDDMVVVTGAIARDDTLDAHVRAFPATR